MLEISIFYENAMSICFSTLIFWCPIFVSYEDDFVVSIILLLFSYLLLILLLSISFLQACGCFLVSCFLFYFIFLIHDLCSPPSQLSCHQASWRVMELVQQEWRIKPTFLSCQNAMSLDISHNLISIFCHLIVVLMNMHFMSYCLYWCSTLCTEVECCVGECVAHV